MENKIMSSDDKVVDLEEYKKSPLHKQRLEEQKLKPKSNKPGNPKKNNKNKNENSKGFQNNFNKKTALTGAILEHSLKHRIIAFLIMLFLAALLCLGFAGILTSGSEKSTSGVNRIMQMPADSQG